VPSRTVSGQPYGGVRPLFIKVFGLGQRDADLLYRAYRFARLRGVGDTRPAASPVKMSLLLGGSALVTLSYIGALAAAVMAFGAGPPIPTIGAVYLGAAAIAAAPTPVIREGRPGRDIRSHRLSLSSGRAAAPCRCVTVRGSRYAK
jgi:hypothetical protein